MLFDQPDREELIANFEAALEAAQMGRGPSTARGFDAKTFDALRHLAGATDQERDSVVSAARREFAKQLDGTHSRQHADELVESLMSESATASSDPPAGSEDESTVAGDEPVPTRDDGRRIPQFPERPETIHRSDWTVPVEGKGTIVHQGSAPTDPDSGENHTLTVWANETSDEFEIYVYGGGGGGSVDDPGLFFQIEDPDEMIRLKQSLGAFWGNLVQAFAKGIQDGRIPIPGPRDDWMDFVNFPPRWLDERGVKYFWAQRGWPMMSVKPGDYKRGDKPIKPVDFIVKPAASTANVRPVPTAGRGTCVYRGILEGDPYGHDRDLTVYAYNSEDGFELSTHDGGHYPVDELHTTLWVEPEHVPDLLKALKGNSGDDPVDLLAQQIESGVIPVKEQRMFEYVCIFGWFSENGVPYTSDSKFVSNL